jgi:hypothetical protein
MKFAATGIVVLASLCGSFGFGSTHDETRDGRGSPSSVSDGSLLEMPPTMWRSSRSADDPADRYLHPVPGDPLPPVLLRKSEAPASTGGTNNSGVGSESAAPASGKGAGGAAAENRGAVGRPTTVALLVVGGVGLPLLCSLIVVRRGRSRRTGPLLAATHYLAHTESHQKPPTPPVPQTGHERRAA